MCQTVSQCGVPLLPPDPPAVLRVRPDLLHRGRLTGGDVGDRVPEKDAAHHLERNPVSVALRKSQECTLFNDLRGGLLVHSGICDGEEEICSDGRTRKNKSQLWPF